MKYQTNIVIPTRIKDTVYRKLQEDYDLRKAIADKLGKRENAIYQLACRKSESPNYFVIFLFQIFTGWSNEEMCEYETNSQNQLACQEE